MTAIVQVEGETYLHLSDGQFWVPARVSKQIADYIDKGSLFVCCLLFCLYNVFVCSGSVEVGDIVQLNKTLGSLHNLAIVIFIYSKLNQIVFIFCFIIQNRSIVYDVCIILGEVGHKQGFTSFEAKSAFFKSCSSHQLD